MVISQAGKPLCLFCIIIFTDIRVNLKNMGKRYAPFLVSAILLSAAVASGQSKTGQDTVTVVTDKPGAVYDGHETITFTIKVRTDSTPAEGKISYVLSNDGTAVLKKGTLELHHGTAQLHFRQTSPMIVRCTASYDATAGRRAMTAMAAAAVKPYKIRPTAMAPPDFMQYWNSQKAALAKIPIGAQLKLVSDSPAGVKVYDITLANVNHAEVHGYFGQPEGKGPFPAVLYIPGAGVGSASKEYARSMAEKGFLVMAISVHDLPNGQPAQFYKNQYAGPLKAYYLQGRENRNTYYFHRVILGCVRAMDYLTSRSDWDHSHMVVNGSSQGGGLTLITTGLDSRVTAAAANVPALCDHSGRNDNRPSGWPQLAPVDADGRLNPAILRVAGYYDAVNFARMIRVPVIFGVGLIDNTCHPTTVFSAYNVIGSPKSIDIAPLMGHAFDPAYNKMLEAFILKEGGK